MIVLSFILFFSSSIAFLNNPYIIGCFIFFFNLKKQKDPAFCEKDRAYFSLFFS